MPHEIQNLKLPDLQVNKNWMGNETDDHYFDKSLKYKTTTTTWSEILYFYPIYIYICELIVSGKADKRCAQHFSSIKPTSKIVYV